MITIPDPDISKPLKYNILYLLMSGRYDIIAMYEILKKARDMPDDRHKYQGIEHALRELDKEGFALHKDIVKGVAYYSASPETVLKIYENVLKEHKNMDHDASLLNDEIQFTDNVYEKLGHGSYLGIDNSQASRLNGYLDENWYYVDKKGHIKKIQR